MNIKQVKKLSNEELRIRVAELCGWTGPWRNGNVHSHGYRPGRKAHPDAGDWNCTRNRTGEEHCPDYPRDLNACHEMEESLVEPHRFKYEAVLHSLNRAHGLGISVWETIHAGARQRCEAFVLTLSEGERCNPCEIEYQIVETE